MSIYKNNTTYTNPLLAPHPATETLVLCRNGEAQRKRGCFPKRTLRSHIFYDSAHIPFALSPAGRTNIAILVFVKENRDLLPVLGGSENMRDKPRLT